MKIPKIHFGHSVLFKAPGYSSAKNMAESGNKFINPNLRKVSGYNNGDNNLKYTKADEEIELEKYINRQSFSGII
jgi:hypothetical protein